MKFEIEDYDIIDKLRNKGYTVTHPKSDPIKNKLNKHPYLTNGFLGRQYSDQDDYRYLDWVKQEQQKGFADYQLWELDEVMIELLYERLKGFKWIIQEDEKSSGENYSNVPYRELVNLCKQVINSDGINTDKKETKIWQLWSKYCFYFWY